MAILEAMFEQEQTPPAPAGAELALLTRLRAVDLAQRVASDSPHLAEWMRSGVRFVASSPPMEAQYYRALRELIGCIRPTAGAGPILNEGGIYHGAWLESTGTICAEALSRFLPSVAGRTLTAFAAHRREDGLLPYKLTADGPAFSQIQIVSPLARSVWAHYLLTGRDRAFLRTMFEAMARADAWLARHRDTRGTGGVEAFCCYDTGHDRSARFWHVPDSPPGNDPTRFDHTNPLLPFVAPDLTANAACQRAYLALMAEELGEDGAPWRRRSGQSLQALFAQCFDEADAFFYDRDALGRHVRVRSDVLLRVLACEVGDDNLFATALDRHLLNTGRFFARYPFTSLALDDPRFDHAYAQNSWSGPTNLLSLLRAPHAFEAHGRHTELTWAMQPTLAALVRAPRFGQTLDPFTGETGFTEQYSPAILCLIDFLERLCGILPRPDGELWFTALVPRQAEHRDTAHQTAYSRIVDGHTFELVNAGGQSFALSDARPLFRCPAGVRVITDRAGAIRSLVGVTAGAVAGTLATPGATYPFRIAANERLDLRDGRLVSAGGPGLVPPSY